MSSLHQIVACARVDEYMRHSLRNAHEREEFEKHIASNLAYELARSIEERFHGYVETHTLSGLYATEKRLVLNVFTDAQLREHVEREIRQRVCHDTSTVSRLKERIVELETKAQAAVAVLQS